MADFMKWFITSCPVSTFLLCILFFHIILRCLDIVEVWVSRPRNRKKGKEDGPWPTSNDS